MTKIDIFSGFLGAGKTTLIKKLVAEAFHGEQIVIIENEFGEIGIDGGFLKDSGVQITEMNSGCICCSLVGDFGKALQKVIDQYHPARIIIEPSGVGKLSDVVAAVLRLKNPEIEVTGKTAVVDASKCKVYMKNFGEFYNNQIETASTIILSRTGNIAPQKLQDCLDLIAQHNTEATVVTTPWDQLTGEQLLSAIEHDSTLSSAMNDLMDEVHEHHHNDDDDDDDECCCHHHHDDDDDDHDEHEHHHHHHHDDDDDDDDECCCHHHHDDDDDDDHDEHEHHHHHHHHHADEVFTSWGAETAKKFTTEGIQAILTALNDNEKYGIVLRAKGIVAGEDQWIHFDFVPEEPNVRFGSAEVTGRICVIGSKLNEDALKELFGV